MIPFLNLNLAHAEIENELFNSTVSAIQSGTYIGGRLLASFEAAFANYCGARFAVGVGNGLDALILALRALDIGPGDEVLVPSHTFIATWLAVQSVGAKIVPIEPNEQTYTIDVDRLESAITERTRAIIPVHLYGQPSDLDPILQVAVKYKLKVIEDAAQSHGARYKGKRIGAHGDIVAWSFYPGKNLGALGDGGAISTDNPQLADKVRSLGNYGSREKYVHEHLGQNSRLDEIQADMLSVKLKYLDEWNHRRACIARTYLTEIRNPSIILPEVPAWADPVWHLFVIRHAQRDRLQAYLRDAGVQSLIHYPTPPHLQTCFQSVQRWPNMALTETLAKTVLSLPIGPHLATDEAMEIVRLVNKFH